MAMTLRTEHTSFVQPDEIRHFPHGRAEMRTLGGSPVGRLVFEPGWRWSNDAKPIAQTARSALYPRPAISHSPLSISGRIWSSLSSR